MKVSRRSAGAVVALVVSLLVVGGASRPSVAQTGERRLTVTPNENLDPQGHKVKVQGSGYDTTRGIYVAWCVVPKPGEKPTPCGGGDDRSGESGQAVWISSNPAYGATLARSYGPGGSFEVEILVSRRIGDVDCFEVACAVTTRNDHEHTDDRGQDVFAPVRFVGQSSVAAAPAVPSGEPGPSSPPTTAAPPRAAPSTPPPASATPTTTAAAVAAPTAPAAPTAVTADPLAPATETTIAGEVEVREAVDAPDPILAAVAGRPNAARAEEGPGLGITAVAAVLLALAVALLARTARTARTGRRLEAPA